MLEGIPTNKGIQLLNTNIQESITHYALIGKELPEDEELKRILQQEDIEFNTLESLVFLKKNVEVGYFDEEGILTYEISLNDIETNNYLYGIVLLDNNSNILASLLTPQVVLTRGVGGLLTIKLPIHGKESEVVFVNSDYVSRKEFEAMKLSLKPPEVDLDALVEKITPPHTRGKGFL